MARTSTPKEADHGLNTSGVGIVTDRTKTQPWVAKSIETPVDTWRKFCALGLGDEFLWHCLFEPWGLCSCSRCTFWEAR